MLFIRIAAKSSDAESASTGLKSRDKYACLNSFLSLALELVNNTLSHSSHWVVKSDQPAFLSP